MNISPKSIFQTSQGDGRNARPSSRRTDLEPALFWLVIIILAIAPIFLGSNRALAWSAWATCLGTIGSILFFLLWRSNRSFSVSRASLLPGLLIAGTVLWLIVQLIPLPGLPETAGVPIRQISVAPNLTSLMLLRQNSYAVLALLIIHLCKDEGRRRNLLNILLSVTCVYGLYALISLQTGDTILGIPKWAYEGSATGPFVNRNSFATYCAFGSMIALGQVSAMLVRQSQRHSSDGRIPRLFSTVSLYLVAYFFLLVVILLTKSRMGLFSMTCGTMIITLATGLKTRHLKLSLLAIAASLALFACAIYLAGAGLAERLEFYDFTLESRAPLYDQVLEMIRARLWTGFGGGTFEVAFPTMRSDGLNPDLVWDKAHNTYLTLWSELGVVAGSFPILAVILCLFSTATALLKGHGSWAALITALGVIIVGGIHSLVDFSLEMEANAFVFVALVSLGVVATGANKRSGA